MPANILFVTHLAAFICVSAHAQPTTKKRLNEDHSKGIIILPGANNGERNNNTRCLDENKNNNCRGYKLSPGERLYRNQYLCAGWESDIHRFGLNSDGLLADWEGRNIHWSVSGNNKNNYGDYVEMQDDGNLVLYNKKKNKVIWAIGCAGYDGDDASLKKYEKPGVEVNDRGNVLWEIHRDGTERRYFFGGGRTTPGKRKRRRRRRRRRRKIRRGECKGNGRLNPGKRLYPNEYICGDSSNLLYRFGLDEKGLLHDWGNGRIQWSSRMYGDYLHMQKDGNLVVYKDGTPQWASNTKVAGAYLKKTEMPGIEMLWEPETMQDRKLIWRIDLDGKATKCPCY